MKLNEVFDSKPEPIKWKTKSKTNWFGQFMIGDFPFVIAFDAGYRDKSDFEVVFGLNEPRVPNKLRGKIKTDDYFGILGTGNQGKVFSTILAAIKNFTKSVKPTRLHFSAEEPSRMKLYKRMVTRLAPSLGYKPEMTGDYFQLVRKD
jgi:hypothetical protein